MGQSRKMIPDLPDGQRTLAFRAVVQILRDDPVLNSVVRTWLTRDGLDDQLQDPAFGMTPMVALSPVPRPDGLFLTNTEATVNLGIAVGVWVPGSCVDDALNLWDAVTRALWLQKEYRGGTVQDFLRCGIPGVSIPNLTVADPAFISVMPGDRAADPAIQRGLGTIGLFFMRPR